MSWCCHGLEARKRIRIDDYGDLLSPMHRSFAQIVLGASNEPPNDASDLENVPIAQCFVVKSYYTL